MLQALSRIGGIIALLKILAIALNILHGYLFEYELKKYYSDYQQIEKIIEEPNMIKEQDSNSSPSTKNETSIEEKYYTD